MKKKILLGLASMLVFTGVANAEVLDEEFNKVAPNGVFNIKAIKPTEAQKNESGEDYYPELRIFTNLRVQKILDKDNYDAKLENCNEDLTSCILSISDYTNESKTTEKEVKVVWSTGNEKNKAEIDKYANKVAAKINSAEYKTAIYNLTDLALINYIKNYKENQSVTALYSPDLKAEFDNSNIEYELYGGMGDGAPFYLYIGGSLVLGYNDIMYKMLNVGYVGVNSNYILYIPDETENNAEAFAAAAKKRIDEYLGNTNSKVEVAGFRSDFAIENSFDFSELGDESKMSDSYYKVTIGQKTYDFVIMKDSSKIEKPVTTTKDIATNVSVITTSSEIPLDTTVTVNEIKKDTEEHKTIIDVIKTEVFQAFDISLFSASKNSNITKLENGNFKVTIPVKEELKDKKLYAYYIKEDKTLEEHEVTIDENGNASFETNHFSTYILSEKINTNNSGEVVPATNDNIITYVVLGLVAVIGLTTSIIVLNKKSLN